MTHRGFITLHRKLSDWEWYKDVTTFKLFIHLLLNANFQPKKYKGILIERGEILTGRIELAKNTGLSVQQVRTSINKLKSTNDLTTKSTNQFTIIKLVNYGMYQDKKEKSNQQINQQPNQRITNEQPTDNQRITTTNKENNINNVTLKTIEEHFEIFWKNYTPIKTLDGKVTSKGSKKPTFTAYQKAIAIYTPEVISDGLERYLKHCQANSILTCGATVFLNQERFLNDETVVINASTKQTKTSSTAEIYNSLMNKYENEENAN